jgi:hypothetical protein
MMNSNIRFLQLYFLACFAPFPGSLGSFWVEYIISFLCRDFVSFLDTSSLFHAASDLENLYFGLEFSQGLRDVPNLTIFVVVYFGGANGLTGGPLFE